MTAKCDVVSESIWFAFSLCFGHLWDIIWGRCVDFYSVRHLRVYSSAHNDGNWWYSEWLSETWQWHSHWQCRVSFSHLSSWIHSMPITAADPKRPPIIVSCLSHNTTPPIYATFTFTYLHSPLIGGRFVSADVLAIHHLGLASYQWWDTVVQCN